MDLILVLGLILFNGFFAMAEIAVVSSRKSKLKNMGANGNKRSKIALSLAEQPNAFLSSVQIGITLITILAGALSEDRFVPHIAPILKPIPFIGQYSEAIAFAFVVISITYLSIVLGELVPKRIALTYPERIASLIAPIMYSFAKVTAPIVKILSASTEFIFKLIGLKSRVSPQVTEDEVRILIREGTDMGIFSKTEKKLIERALILDDLKVAMLMTPKHKMMVVDIQKFFTQIKQYLSTYPHSRLILTQNDESKVIGIIHVKDLLKYTLNDEPLDYEKLKNVINKPHLIPESMKAIKVLEMFRHSPVHIAIVLDEFGEIQGLITLNDILEALVGEIKTQSPQEATIVVRENGSFLIDGSVSLYDMNKKLHLVGVSDDELKAFQTVAGFVIANLEKIPKAGDYFEKYSYRFEVVDMDDNRVDKILARKISS